MLPLDADIAKLLSQFQSGESTAIELGQKILELAVASQGSITPDTDRKRRCGYPEVIYGLGKTPDSIRQVTEILLESNEEILITRVSPDQVCPLSEWFSFHRWNHVGKTLRIGRKQTPLAPEDVGNQPQEPVSSEQNVATISVAASSGTAKCVAAKCVAVVSAGTTDEPVALEAQETLAWMGVPTVLIQDVGVAGPYRLMSKVPLLQKMSAIVCVAGMEGALPSVLGGHVACPVIAVPTSVGYGANFAGLSALLSMLNCCASNVAVVNIDAGFKGGYMAGLIANGLSR